MNTGIYIDMQKWLMVDQVGIEPTSPAAWGYSPLGLPVSRLIHNMVRIEGFEPSRLSVRSRVFCPVKLYAQ